MVALQMAMMGLAKSMQPLINSLRDMASWLAENTVATGVIVGVLTTLFLAIKGVTIVLAYQRAVATQAVISALSLASAETVAAGATTAWAIAGKALQLSLGAAGLLGLLVLLYHLIWEGDSPSLIQVFGLLTLATYAYSLANSSTAIPSIMAAITGFYGLATAIWTAMAPFLPIIAVIAVLGLAIYGLVKYWDDLDMTIRHMTGGVFTMTDALLLILGPVGMIIVAFKKIYENWDSIVASFSRGAGIVKSVFSSIGEVISNTFGGIADAIRWTVNKMISAVNFMIRQANKAINYVPGVDFIGGTVNYQIEHLANGTSNFAGGPALLGERGPELTYLQKGTTVVSHQKTVEAAREVMGAPALPGKKGATVTADDIKTAFVAAGKELGIDRLNIAQVLGNAIEKAFNINLEIPVLIGEREFGRAVADVNKNNHRLKPGAR